MESEGIKFVKNADVGNTIPAAEILNSFDAVILCCGAENPRDINVPGRNETNGIYFCRGFPHKEHKKPA